MPWADDTRCLFCDGKLPLYRKLTQGQFCSKPHQDAYWKEQNQLAVEVLHRTHDALQSYKPAVPIEDILGPSVPAATPAPAEPWWAVSQTGPVAEPVRFEVEPEPPPTFSYAIPEPKPFIVQRSAPEPLPLPERQAEDDFSFSYALPQFVEKREPEPELAYVPEIAGILTQGWNLELGASEPGMMAADPVEYEAHIAWEVPRTSLDPLPVVLESAPPEMATAVPLLALIAAIGETSPYILEIEPREAGIAIEAPELEYALATRMPEAATVALSAGRLAHSPWPSAPVEPVAFIAAPVHIADDLDRSLAPCGDAISQLEREAFPLSETVFGLAAPKPAALAAAVAASSEGFQAFAAPVVHQPAFAWTAPVPRGLPEATELAALRGEFAPHVWNSARVAWPEPLETPANCASLPAAGLGIDFNPSLAGPVSTHEMAFRDHTGAHRPVCFQAFTPSGELERPTGGSAAGAHSFAPNLYTEVFRLDMLGKLRPRACSLPLRGVLPPIFELGEPLLPKARLEVRSWRSPLGQAAALASLLPEVASRLPRNIANGAAHFWSHAPRDLKILMFAVPLALGLAFTPSLPKVSTKAPGAPTAEVSGFRQTLDTQLGNLRQAMADRAAVGLDENFRHGLDNWQAIDGSTAEWSFDQAGFVVPGRVALYKPSLGLKDYELQFLGAIDKKALSWVVRAADFQNFYVVKLEVVNNGPIPRLNLMRYAVINGKSVQREDTPVVIDARRDSLYRVSMTVAGGHYAVAIQGRMIDSWDEPRLKHGGVGFFTGSGEQSRIGWVQVTHQYDMLGRLFAYLAP